MQSVGLSQLNKNGNINKLQLIKPGSASKKRYRLPFSCRNGISIAFTLSDYLIFNNALLTIIDKHSNKVPIAKRAIAALLRIGYKRALKIMWITKTKSPNKTKLIRVDTPPLLNPLKPRFARYCEITFDPLESSRIKICTQFSNAKNIFMLINSRTNLSLKYFFDICICNTKCKGFARNMPIKHIDDANNTMFLYNERLEAHFILKS